MEAVILQDIWFGYRPDRATLRGVSLAVNAGEIVGLLGRNGAGKTTTFRILTGLLRPERGSVIVGGFDAASHRVEVQRRIAFMPTTPLLYEQLSAEENLNMFALLWGVEAAAANERSHRLLHEVGLWDVRHDWVESYSTGMKQRLSICVAILLDPAVIVMDEPFNGLDIDGTLWAREMLQTLARSGKAILLSSHVPELIEAVAHTVAVLDDGRIVEQLPMVRVAQLGGLMKYFDLKARSCA